MGANATMYTPRWQALPGFVSVNWPQYRGETTLQAIARRLVDEQSMKDGDSIIGYSLGGMVACEIAQVRKVGRLVLISSATSKHEISGLLSFLHPLIDLVPIEFLRRAASSIPQELAQMFGRCEPDFIRAACRAIFDWDGLPAHIKCVRIHGRYDRVIPLPANIDCVLEGGHLIGLTHPNECISFLRKKLLSS